MFKSITPTLSIVASIILFVFFTQPLYQEVREINAEIQDYTKTTNDYEIFNAELSALLSQKNTIRVADRERLDRIIPNALDNTRTLVDLEAMASSHNLLFGNVDVKVGQPKSFTGTNSNNSVAQFQPNQLMVTSDISFDVIGSYEQFKNFIRTIEGSLTFMEVKEISFSSSEGMFQQYSVTVQTYALPKS